MERMAEIEMEAVAAQEEGFATDFGQALEHVKYGGKAARAKWIPGGMWIRLVEPEGTSDFDYGMENMPYLEMKTAEDTLVPWVASYEDLLAEDWMLLDEGEY